MFFRPLTSARIPGTLNLYGKFREMRATCRRLYRSTMVGRTVSYT